MRARKKKEKEKKERKTGRNSHCPKNQLKSSALCLQLKQQQNKLFKFFSYFLMFWSVHIPFNVRVLCCTMQRFGSFFSLLWWVIVKGRHTAPYDMAGGKNLLCLWFCMHMTQNLWKNLSSRFHKHFHIVTSF